MSSPVLSDEKTNEIAEDKTKGTREDRTVQSSKIKKKFAQMLVDFNIIPYIIGFAIAMSFAELMTALSQSIINKYFKELSDFHLLVKFISFLLILFISYVFGYLIFYKFVYTEDIAKQTMIKKAINEKKEEEIKKEIDKDPETRQIIQSSAEINKDQDIEKDGIIEGFGLFSQY